jgi:hypothetical protein
MLSSERGNAARLARAALATLLIAMVAAACAGAAGPALQPDGNTVGGAPIPGSGARGASGEGEDDGAGDGDSQVDPILYAAGQEGLLIIKNGTLVLQVTGIDAALTAATQHITNLGGYASGSDRSGDGEAAQATVTYRIPAARWDDALTGLHGLAEKVLVERATTEDVTDQVVDLGARIRNLEATERALQAIMDRATEIKDVLAVQAELTSVRGQIEQLTAQKTNLEGQAAFSTLSVTFALKPNPVLTSTEQFDPAAEVDEASASLVSVLQGLATAGIWFAIVWLPILIALAIVGGIGLYIFRRVRRAGGDGSPVAPAPEGGA